MLCLCAERPAAQGVERGCPLCLWERYAMSAGKEITLTEERLQQYLLLLELAADLMLAPSTSPELRARLSRILRQAPKP